MAVVLQCCCWGVSEIVSASAMTDPIAYSGEINNGPEWKVKAGEWSPYRSAPHPAQADPVPHLRPKRPDKNPKWITHE